MYFTVKRCRQKVSSQASRSLERRWPKSARRRRLGLTGRVLVSRSQVQARKQEVQRAAGMSSGGPSSVARFDRVREFPHYDQVPADLLSRHSDSPPGPAPWLAAVPALSLDPLPPPPLPEQPAVGPESLYAPVDDEPVEEDCDAMDIKPVRRFIPDSVKNLFRGNSGGRGSKGLSPPSPPHSSTSSRRSAPCQTTEGVPCSPPHSAPASPSLPGSHRDRDRLLLGSEALDSASAVPTTLSALTYQERVEEYHQRYAYMKSWAGLLRILGCVELLLGAAVFACVCAYVHKDNEWFNMYGYSQPQVYGGLGGLAGGGYQYTGPKTPFVLVVAGLAWIVTVILVVLGMSLYYRAILLDSSWWPLTECSINLALAVLYLAAGVVYVRDTTRGGLCYIPVFNNGINGAFCRTEAGQSAAIAFLFLTMVLYFISAGVCLKLWRHEAARMRKEGLEHEVRHAAPGALVLTWRTRKTVHRDTLVGTGGPSRSLRFPEPDSFRMFKDVLQAGFRSSWSGLELDLQRTLVRWSVAAQLVGPVSCRTANVSRTSSRLSPCR